MASIHETMTSSHRHCDELFAQVEADIDKGDWNKGRAGFERFLAGLEGHFRLEEEQLFPELERRVGAIMGPTQMMRMEHGQMRQTLLEMEAAIGSEQREEYLGLADTLMMMLQQHNIKEEQVLYTMADKILCDEVEQWVEKLSP